VRHPQLRLPAAIVAVASVVLALALAGEDEIAWSAALDPEPCQSTGHSALPRPLGACEQLYSNASPFNRPLPPRPRSLPGTAQIVRRTVEFGPAPSFTGGVVGTSYDWGHPIYFSKGSDPVSTVHCTQSAAWGRCKIEGARVHIPAAAQPAAGGDGHLAVIDRATGWEYDFWQVQRRGADLTVGWGGRTRVDGDGLGSDATAAGFGLAAGIVRPEELAAGEIDHALFMVVKCTNGTSVWPAGSNSGRTCASMGLPNAGAPALGQHFFLDLSPAKIEALARPAWQKTILRAMAEYGLFVGDTGTAGWGIGVESGASYTSLGHPDPWVQLGRRLKVPSWASRPNRRRFYEFNLAAAVDWAAELKVLRAPGSPRPG